MRIGVDVMGGDNAPGAILDGVVAALDYIDSSDELILAGDEAIIRSGLAERGADADRYTIVPTSETIAMDEPPVEAVRSKPDSPLAVLAKMASRKAENPLDVFISAGNTGAQVTAAQMHMRRLPNVHRPGIAVVIPTFYGPIVLIDVGANIEPKPHHLSQYGVMGAIFAQKIVGIENPRVALMNVGGEEAKGTTEMKRARDLLRGAEGINFNGYIEGRGVFAGEADVIVTDGVTGNVMLKLAEGLSDGIFKAISKEAKSLDPNLAQQVGGIAKRLYAQYDYHEYGGAPLLGVNGVCIISHGSSIGRTICNAVLAGRRAVLSRVNDAISETLGTMQMEELPA